jgi:hypothetical protein
VSANQLPRNMLHNIKDAGLIKAKRSSSRNETILPAR